MPALPKRGKPLTVKIQDGALIIELGVDTFAHAWLYADTAHRLAYDLLDQVRLKIVASPKLAKAFRVAHEDE